MTYDVFISHASKDKLFATALRQHLADQGVTCWIDKEGIALGEDWTEKIGDALKSVSAIVLVYSSNVIDSENVKDEIAIAAKRKLAIIPIRIEDVEPSSFFEVRLARYNWLDVFEKQQEKLSEVASGIKASIDKLRSKNAEGVTLGAPSTLSNNSAKTKTIEKETDQLKAGISASARGTSNENIYLDLLQMAYADGIVSSSERDALNRKAKELSITPERAKELEEQVKKQSGASNITSTANIVQSEAASDGDVAWPSTGHTFIKAIKKSLDVSMLPFQPLPVMDDKEIEEEKSNPEIDWEINDKYYFAVWLASKRKDKIDVRWGIYSSYEKRDPLFRKTSDELEDIKELLDKDEDVSIDGVKYLWNDEEGLGQEASERKIISEINNPEFIKHVVDNLLAFANKAWPVIKKNLVKS